MRKPLILVLTTLLTLTVHASAQDGAVGKVSQQKKNGFIQQMFAAPPARRVKLLGLAVGHRMYSSDKALELAELVVSQEDVKADNRSYAQAMLHLSACHFGRGQVAESGRCARKAGEIAEPLGDAELIFKAACQEGLVAREIGGVSTALVHLERVREQLDRLGATEFDAHCLNLMGSLAEVGGSPSRATLLYSRAHERAIQYGDPVTAAKARMNLGAMLTRIGRLDEGLEVLRDALSNIGNAETEKTQPTMEFLVRLSVAENELQRGQNQKALEDIRKLLHKFEKKVGQGQQALAHEVTARALLYLRRYKEAHSEIATAISLLAQRQRSYYQLQTTKAQILSAMGNHSAALREVDSVLDKTNVGMKALYLRAAWLRSDILSAGGRDGEAVVAARHAREFQNKLHQQELAADVEIAHAMTQLAEEQESAKLELAAAESRESVNKIVMYMTITLGVLGVLTAIFVARLYTHRRLAEREREATRVLAARTQEMNAQLESELNAKAAKLRTELESRAELERALQQARQIEAVGTLTSGVAHDFNNLMTVVLSSNEALRITAGDRLKPRELMALDESTQAAKSGAIITRQLLEMARSKPNNPRPIHVKTFIEKIQGLLRRTMGDMIELEIDYQDPDATVFVDSTRLTTALMNLCCNARDAIDDGGVVRLEVRTGMAGDHKFAMEVESMHPRTQLVFLQVSDEGCGMRPDELVKAKDPLFTTKAESRGTGLGLSVVQGFAGDAGGLLHLESVASIGTHATIVLPVCTLGEVVSIADVDDAMIAEMEGLSVVVVDDEKSVLSSVSRALLMLGCSVERYTEAKQVQEQLEMQQPDLVLADIRIPGTLDGLDLARLIRLRHPTMGIVLMTGCSDELGSEFVTLKKPFSLNELAATLTGEARRRATPLTSGVLAGTDKGPLDS